MQKLPETAPKYADPMEWDNMAVLNVTPLSNGDKQIGFKARTKPSKQRRRVVVREVPFDDALARGIWEIYNECPVRQEGVSSLLERALRLSVT